MLRLKGSKSRDLEEESRGNKEVAQEKLPLKYKTFWSRSVKRLPEKVLEEWPEAELQEVNKDWGKATKQKSWPEEGIARSAKHKPPETDEAKVVLTVAGKRRLCREFPPQKIRAGMLSARLRERYGYLCTETDA